MRLKSVHITDFKSIRDTGEFEIADTTCLVGKNEAGKTAILEALYRLNPIINDQGNFNVTEDYPRIDVDDYEIVIESGKKDPAIVVRTTFILERKELENIAVSLGPEIIANPEIKLSKGYENRLIVSLNINEDNLTRALVVNSDISPDLIETFSKHKTINDLYESIKPHEGDSTIKPLLDVVSEVKQKGPIIYIFSNFLHDSVPKFLYFDEYYQMEGQVNIEALIKRENDGQLRDSDRPLLGLIELARLSLERLTSHENTQALINKLEGASNHISKKTLKYWSQNKHIELTFDIR